MEARQIYSGKMRVTFALCDVSHVTGSFCGVFLRLKFFLKNMTETNLKKARHNVILGILGSLMLGLAPFYPEPHLFGKIRWVLGGAHGMAAMDWFDLAMHGAPVVFLLWALWTYFKLKNRQAAES